jgi:hypothetical protein
MHEDYGGGVDDDGEMLSINVVGIVEARNSRIPLYVESELSWAAFENGSLPFLDFHLGYRI